MDGSKLSFTRSEKKYLLSREQYHCLLRELEEYTVPDVYPHSTVCSIYYDDDSFSMIRASIEMPEYKEKLRIRSYGIPGEDSPVYVELKKKFRGTVYKRRVLLPCREAERWLAGDIPAPGEDMTFREIDTLLRRRTLTPKVCIACDRLAFAAKDDPALRITFDLSLRFRDNELSLRSGDSGEELLKDGAVLMEIKLQRSAPLWLAKTLSRFRIYPTSFSKYGTCYKQALIDKHFLHTEDIHI